MRTGRAFPIPEALYVSYASHDHRQIGTQLIVIVQVFVSQTNPAHPLRYQTFHQMLDESRISMVGKARFKLPKDSGPLLHFAQPKSTGICGDISTIKMSHNFSIAQWVSYCSVLHSLTRKAASV